VKKLESPLLNENTASFERLSGVFEVSGKDFGQVKLHKVQEILSTTGKLGWVVKPT
jgi:hypothetical protein